MSSTKYSNRNDHENDNTNNGEKLKSNIITVDSPAAAAAAVTDVSDAWGTFGGRTQANVARMPVERYASEYNMKHKNRGHAIIFNHEHFEISSLKQRSGTNVDCENLSHTLKLLHFHVVVHKDLRLKDIQMEIEELSKLDHTDNDCLLIAILSHGELGYIYARDCQYKLDTIWYNFTAANCPSLAGKPKLFFIQACQGDQLDGGIIMTNPNDDDDQTLNMLTTETDGDSSTSYRIPTHADFLIAYSTIPGFFSWRNTTKGSWFMQCLCQELNQHGKRYDLLTLLTFVCQRVAIDYESNTPDNLMMHQQKQIPCVTTMLTRILKFNDK